MEQWYKGSRPSMESPPRRLQNLTDLTTEELVSEIHRLRAENRILQAQVDLCRRWLEEFGHHPPRCMRHRGLRCDCGLICFIEE